MAPISESRVFLIFSFILVHLGLGLMATAQPPFSYRRCMGGNYTSDGIFRRNLDTALSSLTNTNGTTGNTNSGYYNITVGQNPDTVYAMGLCRGDIVPNRCRSCLNESIIGLTERCSNQVEAIGYYDYCTLRYSNRTMFGVMETRPAYFRWNNNRVFNSSLGEFNQAINRLFDGLTLRAAGSSWKFATGNTTGPESRTIYGHVQCTPDLSNQNCRSCLTEAARQLPGCCEGQVGARVYQPNCNIRYEIYRFYDVTSAEGLPVEPPPSADEFPVMTPPPHAEISPVAPPLHSGRDKNTARTIIIIVIPIVISLIFIICLCIFLRRRKLRKPKEKLEIVDDNSIVESLQYDFDYVSAATDGFSSSNKLGQGGFGAVYKGKFPSGQDIAVKRLSMDSGQGDLEFKNEVLLVAKLQHRNLVRLLGFCMEGAERLLIYEFVHNASLDHFIFDPIKSPFLDWGKRYKIIAGVCRGLLYLHEDSRLRIVHRDLKASNILLDRDMNPKIADFGMARLFTVDETQAATNRIVGTYGYMAPEYAMHGQFSMKSDVFSFGVLVLEIVSGRKNLCFRDGEMVEDLLSYAWKNWRNGTAENLVDLAIRASTGSLIEIMRCIHIGLLCVQENDTDRPNMASVFLMLNSFSLTLEVPSEPAFFMHSTINPESSLQLQGDDSRAIRSTNSQTKSLCSSVNGDSISEIYPR